MKRNFLPMNYLILLVLFFVLLPCNVLYAAETPEEIAQRVYQANINALMVFTSQDGLNTGHYRFSNIGIKMDIYHLPFLYQLAVGNDSVNMFMMGNVGYSRAYVNEEIILPESTRLSHKK